LTPHQVLKDHFGYNDFRVGQEEIIDAILDNKNVLAVLPTGAGKSLCYQIPALMKESFSIVISPLISLMQDQVESINKNKNIAAFINSSLDYSESQKVLQKIANNKIKLLYVAPEKLKNTEFVNIIKNLSPDYLFIDEAHCISEWGHNFRPSYRHIKKFAEEIGLSSLSAFTATATPDVRSDIINQLEFNDSKVFVYGFERENISLNVQRLKKKNEKVLSLLFENKTPTIIYTATRKYAERLTEFLKLNKVNVEYYHAGLTTELRKVIQDDFLKNNIDVIVATNAFGMGIDKQDIGLVIHYNITGSIENLYQEFGRAGRNGSEAKAYLFLSDKDKFLQEFLIKVNHPSIDQIKNCYNAILDYYSIAVNSVSEAALEIDEGLLKLLNSKSINQNQLFTILTQLELNGYLKSVNNSNKNSFFKILLSQDQLKNYIKSVKNKRFQNFILSLIQYYGAVPFERKVLVKYDQLESLLNINRKQINESFVKLDEIGIITFDRSTDYTKIKMLRERAALNNIYIDSKDIDVKISHSRSKLNSVIKYCHTSDCRFKFILDYFGEGVNNYSCGKCDNCTGKSENDDINNEYVSEIILRTLKEFKGGLTSSRLIGIVTGKSKSHIAKTISTYQSCIHFNEEQINSGIQVLLSKRLIKEVNQKLFFDPVNELLLLEKENRLNEASDYESNLELFNLLRQERNIAAKKFSQSPELICPDKILRKIAQAKPTAPSSLLDVDGFNQRMFNKVGAEFLEILKENSKNIVDESQTKDLPKHISQTYKLIQKGYTLMEISTLLKLPESIVSIQIETIISYFPNENYSKLLDMDDFEEIKNAFESVNDNIKEVKKRVSSKLSYAKIRVVKSILSSQSFSNQI